MTSAIMPVRQAANTRDFVEANVQHEPKGRSAVEFSSPVVELPPRKIGETEGCYSSSPVICTNITLLEDAYSLLK